MKMVPLLTSQLKCEEKRGHLSVEYARLKLPLLGPSHHMNFLNFKLILLV